MCIRDRHVFGSPSNDKSNFLKLWEYVIMILLYTGAWPPRIWRSMIRIFDNVAAAVISELAIVKLVLFILQFVANRRSFSFLVQTQKNLTTEAMRFFLCFWVITSHRKLFPYSIFSIDNSVELMTSIVPVSEETLVFSAIVWVVLSHLYPFSEKPVYSCNYLSTE